MEYQGSGLPARARRREPSWPTVIATTLRLWVQRHPVFGRRGTRGRRAAVAFAAVVLVVLGAFGAWTARDIFGRGAASSSPAAPRVPGQGPLSGPALGASAATRGEVSRWIAGQVAGSAIVACDPAMCAALQADGLPATRLLVLRTAAADPLGSDVVVATSAVRNQFGTRLPGVYAPVVIASFGTGAGRIEVRAIAPDGAATYQATLIADHRSRVSAGSQLLRNPRISATAAARVALSAGDVDSRLLLTLAALAVQQPLRITAFGDPSPGSSRDVPLRSVQLAPLETGNRAAASLRSMLSFIGAQRQPFQPLRAGLDGSSAVTVEYPAPSPLGLLGGP
jgi:hypothetical protein